jgi:hypothetical protein
LIASYARIEVSSFSFNGQNPCLTAASDRALGYFPEFGLGVSGHSDEMEVSLVQEDPITLEGDASELSLAQPTAVYHPSVFSFFDA